MSKYAEFDFETYSSAGYNWDPALTKWVPITNSPPYGLPAVGAAVYSEHPSTEILSLAYDLKDGRGIRLWAPGLPPPVDLFEHIKAGKLIEAHNSAFEYFIWLNVCHKRLGWPPLPYWLLRDSAAKGMAHGLPGSLEKMGEALGANLKIKDGKRLIDKFSKPRNPTKSDPRNRIMPSDPNEVVDALKLYEYNVGDIVAERAVSSRVPELSADELELWLLDQKINFNGVAIDMDGVNSLLSIVDQAVEKYEKAIPDITGGEVQTASQASAIAKWVTARGFNMPDCQMGTVDAMLARDDLPDDVRGVLWTRSMLGSASVKKLAALKRQTCADGRLRDIFAYYGAATGRWAGRGPQPQNLPNSGPAVMRCTNCFAFVSKDKKSCPDCLLMGSGHILAPYEWDIDAVEFALHEASFKSLDNFERYFSDPIAAVGGCLRGLFVAPDGYELICSDYSAIEAVALAMLSGEEWRIDVFRSHGKIYEMSAAKITGIPFETILQHKIDTGEHHPTRKKIGKVAELASGYQGGYHAWLAFGADKHLSETEIKEAVKAWRAASPNVVKFWYGLQEAAISAITYPGKFFAYRDITYGVKDDILYCKLPSGRTLCYHEPRLHQELAPWGKEITKITYMGNNSDYKKGPKGWLRMDTYGGRLCENVVQAVARDILAHAIKTVEAAGYNVVLHVHDEIVAEVPEGHGSVEHFESLMATMPDWAEDYPLKAAGGWRGKRYRKD